MVRAIASPATGMPRHDHAQQAMERILQVWRCALSRISSSPGWSTPPR